MREHLERSRMVAVQRYFSGESPKSICAALGKSKPWLYKWIARYDPDSRHWYRDRSRSPLHPRIVDSAIEVKVIEARKQPEEQHLFCGPRSVLWQLEDEGVRDLPSISTIKRIIKRNHLTKRRSGRYQPKGEPYPRFPDTLPNQMHHTDYLGPRYLAGPLRFYCLSSSDVATKRSATSPIRNRTVTTAVATIWGIWFRLGILVYMQVDNELALRGSNRHPRSLGGIIRLCLHNDVQMIFIPLAEPWRNFAVEKFHDHLQDKWLRRSSRRIPSLRAQAQRFLSVL
jgi:putative transposase